MNLTPVKFSSATQIKKYLTHNKQLLVIISILVISLYALAVDGEFISDDILGIKLNPDAHNVFKSIFTFNIINFLPSLAFLLFGTYSWPLHVWSIVNHIVNSILVFIFVSIFDMDCCNILAGILVPFDT